MGKKKLRAKYTSKGERNAVNPSTSKAVRRDVKSIDRAINKLDAYAKGKKAYVTVPNENPLETNKQFLRVPISQVSVMKKGMGYKKETGDAENQSA